MKQVFLWKSERNRFCFSDEGAQAFLKPLRCRPCWVPCASDMLQRPCEVSRDNRASPGGKNEALGCFQVDHLLMQILFTWSFMVSRLEQIDAVLQATAPTSIQKLAKKKNLTRFTWFLYQVEKSLSSDNGFNLRRANQKLFLPTLAVFLTMIRCFFAKEVFFDLEEPMDPIWSKHDYWKKRLIKRETRSWKQADELDQRRGLAIKKKNWFDIRGKWHTVHHQQRAQNSYVSYRFHHLLVMRNVTWPSST